MDNRSATRILAIDEAYSTPTGLAIVEAGQPVFWRSIPPTRASIARGVRRSTIRQHLATVFDIYPPDLVVVEQARLFHRGKLNLDTALALTSLITSIEDMCLDRIIPCYALNSQDWKYVAVGDRNASKTFTLQCMRALYGPSIKNDGEGDAIAMGTAAYYHPHLLLDELFWQPSRQPSSTQKKGSEPRYEQISPDTAYASHKTRSRT